MISKLIVPIQKKGDRSAVAYAEKFHGGVSFSGIG